MRIPVTLAALLLLGGRSAHAQEDEARIRQRWGLEGLHSVWCVDYLADPAGGHIKLPKGYEPVPASQSADLPAALQRQISDQPGYSAWIPARLCTVSVDVIVVGDRRIAGRKPSQVPSVVFAGVLAAPTSGEEPRPVYAAQFLAATDWRTSRPADAVGLKLDEVKVTTGKVPESTDDQIQVKFGKMELVWSGYATRDSSEAREALDFETVFTAPQGYLWTARFHLMPRMVNPVAGALRVGGKSDLSRSIQASPIRFMGPIYSGGSGEVTYSHP